MFACLSALFASVRLLIFPPARLPACLPACLFSCLPVFLLVYPPTCLTTSVTALPTRLCAGLPV